MNNIDPIIKYISERYHDADKIIEVGIGKLTYTIEKLHNQMPDCKFIVTDIGSPPELPPKVEFKHDDITKPKLSIYENSGLIYSIRPPQELLSYLIETSKTVNSDLLIKSLSTEESPEKGELINYEGTAFYVFKFRGVDHNPILPRILSSYLIWTS